MAGRRLSWRIIQRYLDPTQLVFIDETWAKTNMTRRRGRCKRGARLVEKVTHGHWKTSTLIAALDHQGIRCSNVIDGPINGDAFAAFVQTTLVPTLKPGDIVVLDNLSSHKRADAREMIEAAGASLWFLPPYSPDLAPHRTLRSRTRSASSVGCTSQRAIARSTRCGVTRRFC